MPSELTDLEIDEISLVDRPANPEARVVLVKSAAPPAGGASVFGRLAGRMKAAVGATAEPPSAGDMAADEDDELEDLRRMLAELEAENAELRERLEEQQQGGQEAALRKRAGAFAELAEPAALTPILAALERSQPALAERLERLLAGAQARLAKGALFRELGHAATGGSAYDRLMQRAEALRRREPGLAREQAFARAYEDPENRELVRAYKAERQDRR